MTREEQLKKHRAILMTQQQQLQVRAQHEKIAIEKLEQQSRGYRKERNHRLIVVGATLESLVSAELSPEDVRAIFRAAIGKGGYNVPPNSLHVSSHP